MVKRHFPKILALLIIFIVYTQAGLPELNSDELDMLKAKFQFTRKSLYEPGLPAKSIRKVHPQYASISAWISSVGAAVTITDFDGNHLCNDIVHVDPRFDKVFVYPACSVDTYYKPFEIAPRLLPYDANTMAPMGTLAYDFNADGKMDILVYYWGRTPIIFYQDEKDFREVELCASVERWFSNAATLSDFDGDGNVDVLVSNYFPEGSKVLDENGSDRDQIMQHSMSRAYNGGSSHFFLAAVSEQGNVSYKESTDWKTGLKKMRGWTLAVAAADLTSDLLPEIYFANDFGPDRLLHNVSTPGHLRFRELTGKRRFTDIRSGVLGGDSFKGMGVDFGDINNDGLLDIFVSNIANEFALEESHFAFINTGQTADIKNGIAPFVNKSEELGLSRSAWAWEAKLADFDNDGICEALQATGFIKGEKNKWPELQELAMGNDELLASASVWPDLGPGTDLSGNTHNPFFVQGKNGKFFDISSALGIDQNYVSRGIGISDIDHDGDLDYVVANQWEESFMYINELSDKKAFLGLRILQAIDSNSNYGLNPAVELRTRAAIGAVVKINLPKRKTIIKYVDGGNGHSGKNSNEVFCGLGNIDDKSKIKVTIQFRNRVGAIKNEAYLLNKGWHTIILKS